jgi:hypothetical protein
VEIEREEIAVGEQLGKTSRGVGTQLLRAQMGA